MSKKHSIAHALGCVGIILILALGPGFVSNPAFADPPSAQAHPQAAFDLEVFVRAGCPHCAKAKAFLATLAGERPDLRIAIHDVSQDQTARARLQQLTSMQGLNRVSVPTFYIRGQLLVGFSEQLQSEARIRAALARNTDTPQISSGAAGSCTVVETQTCAPETSAQTQPEIFQVSLFGHTLTLDEIGLPLFTLAMGLLDGFNPCSMWVLVLMISLLAPMQNRWRMVAVAGAFIAVEGLAYLAFMAAWLNLFLFVGLSRLSEIVIAAIAILAGAIHLKDFLAFGRGPSLSIPASAKPGIYARMRGILQAENLAGAIVGAIVLAVLVQFVEFLCTSGFPALYTRILTLRHLPPLNYYGYLLLYNAAYMLDDLLVLGVGVITLSQRRLQEKEGRWLKLLSGAVMVGLGIYLLA